MALIESDRFKIATVGSGARNEDVSIDWVPKYFWFEDFRDRHCKDDN